MNTPNFVYLIAALSMTLGALGGYYARYAMDQPCFQLAREGTVKIDSRTGQTWQLIAYNSKGERIAPYWSPVP
jgi:hypothetical protein